MIHLNLGLLSMRIEVSHITWSYNSNKCVVFLSLNQFYLYIYIIKTKDLLVLFGNIDNMINENYLKIWIAY